MAILTRRPVKGGTATDHDGREIASADTGFVENLPHLGSAARVPAMIGDRPPRKHIHPFRRGNGRDPWSRESVRVDDGTFLPATSVMVNPSPLRMAHSGIRIAAQPDQQVPVRQDLATPHPIRRPPRRRSGRCRGRGVEFIQTTEPVCVHVPIPGLPGHLDRCCGR